MDGVVNVFKPLGLTSARTLDRVRRILGQRKSGHTGTLDPHADGVLLICLGRGTKLVERVMDLPKVYHATARLDVTSLSFDSEGELTPVPCSPPTTADVAAALSNLVGLIEQVPPVISALKVGGRPAYALARRGIAPELPPRIVLIHWITLHEYEWPRVDFTVACGRGTYIRALIRDLGSALGTGGCLETLTRTAIGPFTSAEAHTLENLPAAHAVGQAVVPLDKAAEWIAAGRDTIPPKPTQP
ncbi:MAG: tRNA pseudouridine(55) synthase TruB [Phycisphaerales bacterium]|nr:tRNA pseudouridine(55) synthase TruB [Phycisphaerales bacterium]